MNVRIGDLPKSVMPLEEDEVVLPVFNQYGKAERGSEPIRTVHFTNIIEYIITEVKKNNTIEVIKINDGYAFKLKEKTK